MNARALRFDIDDVPAVLPELLQGPFARATFLPAHVERERVLHWRLP